MPTTKLEVGEDVKVHGLIKVNGGVIQKEDYTNTIPSITAANTTDLGLYSLDPNTYMRFVTNHRPIRFYSDANDPTASWGVNAILDIEPNGQVLIGTSGVFCLGCENYNLYVTKGIRTEKIRVDVEGNWYDIVFNKDYKVKSLAELEKYIEENKHLPNIPSSEEIKKDGVDLGEMQGKLLQQVEEQALYIIALQKQVDKLSKQMKNLLK